MSHACGRIGKREDEQEGKHTARERGHASVRKGTSAGVVSLFDAGKKDAWEKSYSEEV